MAGARPRLAITLGDPRGIGPEIIAAALADPRVQQAIDPVLVGPTGTGLVVQVLVGEWNPGTGTPAEAGRLAGLAVERAVGMALSGSVDGVVTAPLDKAALHAGGFDHPGHTEMLAALAGTPTAMMLASAGSTEHPLRVVLATTHLPLRDVPDAVTGEAIARTVSLAREGLRRWFGIDAPRIALCALNPHAGDGGRFGDEDDRILAPAARAAGIEGPFPADTVFVRALQGRFDAVIAPYHDVGMTAIKVASFGSAVNVTLGLPFPRTSPDHGTALDIAGKGIADPSSMVMALLVAAEMAVKAFSPWPPGHRPACPPPR